MFSPVKEIFVRDRSNRLIMTLNREFKENNRWWFGGDKFNDNGVAHSCCIRKSDLTKAVRAGKVVIFENVEA